MIQLSMGSLVQIGEDTQTHYRRMSYGRQEENRRKEGSQ